MMAASELRDEVRDYIGGAWRRPSSEPGAEVLNPATGEIIARAPAGSAADVAAAVDAAAAVGLLIYPQVAEMEQVDDRHDTHVAMTGTGGYFTRVRHWLQESF